MYTNTGRFFAPLISGVQTFTRKQSSPAAVCGIPPVEQKSILITLGRIVSILHQRRRNRTHVAKVQGAANSRPGRRLLRRHEAIGAAGWSAIGDALENVSITTSVAREPFPPWFRRSLWSKRRRPSSAPGGLASGAPPAFGAGGSAAFVLALDVSGRTIAAAAPVASAVMPLSQERRSTSAGIGLLIDSVR